jgi:predicted PP-loop superfamily ATPase
MREHEKYMHCLRELRLEASLRALESISICSGIKRRLKQLIEERRGGCVKYVTSEKNLCVVALSGGADSTASLILSIHAGMNPIAVTVLSHDHCMTSAAIEEVETLCLTLNVSCEVLDVKEEAFTLFQGALEGRYHPCGRCHTCIEKKVYEYSKKKGISSVVFGDLLSCGSECVKRVDDMMRINLPAMLAMTKKDTQVVSGKDEEIYGCALLRKVHREFPRMRRYSISRVLRETRAGVLTPAQATKYIENIISYSQ